MKSIWNLPVPRNQEMPSAARCLAWFFVAWDFEKTKFFRHCKVVLRLASCQLSIFNSEWKTGRIHRNCDRQRKNSVDGRSDSVLSTTWFLCYIHAVQRFTSSAFRLGFDHVKNWATRTSGKAACLHWWYLFHQVWSHSGSSCGELRHFPQLMFDLHVQNATTFSLVVLLGSRNHFSNAW